MKRIIVFFLLLASFTSCRTVKIGSETITEIKTEYRDTIFYIDRPVMVPLPRDTVRITDTIRIYNNLAYLPPVTKTFGLISVQAGVEKSVLKVQAHLNDSSILHQVKDTVIIENAIMSQTINSTTMKTVQVKFIPGFYKFTLWFFIAACLVFGIWVFVFKLK